MKRSLSVIFVLLMGLILFSGCNLPEKPDIPPTPTEAEITEALPEPTETPTPEPQRDKIAFIPSSENPGVSENLTKALDRLCTEAFECSTVSSEDEIDEDTKFIIYAQEPTALSSLTQRFPQSRFIVVSDPGTKLENAWTIQYDEAFLPFLAGMAVTSSATDWRSAGLIPNDSPVWGDHAEEAFLNGAHYFCGSCRSSLAPYVNFPVVVSLPGSTDENTWSAQLDEAQRSIIYTVFLSDEAMSQNMLQKLVTMNIQIFGVSAPPAGLANNWLATINFDWTATLQQIIYRADSGEGAGTMPLILAITPGSLTEDFSEGKAALLQNAYQDLLSGILSPYSPVTEYTE